MSKENFRLDFYGGKFSALLPFASMMLMIVALVMLGRVSTKLYWVPAFFAICVAFLLSKQKGREFNDTIIGSLSNNMFASFTLIYLLAGVLSFALRQSGLVNGLLWACQTAGVNPALIPMITFLTCIFISTSCGTTGGTVSTVTPVMFPLAVTMGCDPALMLGCIISGGYFGDNLAPISDTTIASAGSMNSDVLSVVKSRIKYSVIAGTLALIMYVFMGFQSTNPMVEVATVDAAAAKTLVMLVIPLIMVILMLKGMELVPVLMICDITALVLDVVMGFVSLDTMFSVKGPVVAGLSSMISLIIFTAFIMILQGFMTRSGLMDDLISKLSVKCGSKRSAELAIFMLTLICVWMCGTNAAAILIVGPVANSLYRKFKIERNRGANILDGVACANTGICPYNGSLLAMFGLAASSGYLPEGFSVFQILPYSYHCIFLIFVYLFAILSGWGRKDEDYDTQEVEPAKV